MYVWFENGGLLRNFMVAFCIAAAIALTCVDSAYAKNVALADWTLDGNTASIYPKYVFNAFSKDGEKYEYVPQEGANVYGLWSQGNGYIVLGAQTADNGDRYDQLQVFDIVDTGLGGDAFFRVVMYSAHGERYGEYFQRYYNDRTDTMYVLFNSKDEPGTVDGDTQDQYQLYVYTTPYAVCKYEKVNGDYVARGWVSTVVTPYYFEYAGGVTNAGFTILNGNPGYSPPHNFGGNNGFGYVVNPNGGDSVHIDVVYSEDLTFWTRNSDYDPIFSMNGSTDTGEQSTLDALGGIEDTISLGNALQAVANEILSAIATSNFQILQADTAISQAMTYIQTSLNRIRDNTEDTADILDLLRNGVSSGISAIQTLQGSANTLQQTANSTLSTISSRISTSNTHLSNLNTKLNNLISEVGGLGVGAAGSGSGINSLSSSVSTTKQALMSNLMTHEPFFTIDAVSTWIGSFSNVSSNATFYIDIPIPFAGTQRFDFGDVLFMQVGGFYLYQYLRYLTSVPILVGCLYASYKMVLNTFGGGE